MTVTTPDPIVAKLQEVKALLEVRKSENRTWKDRYLAIAITELEKIIAFIAVYCLD